MVSKQYIHIVSNSGLYSFVLEDALLDLNNTIQVPLCVCSLLYIHTVYLQLSIII